jgi:hypothetical protein
MPKPSSKDIYLNNPNLPSANATFEYSPEMAKELRKCKMNVLYFAENYFDIIYLDKGKEKIKLHNYQRQALRLMRDNRFSILLFSRQSGKTTCSTIFLLWHAIFNDYQSVLIVANKEDTAKEIFSRMRMAFEGLPNWLKPGVKEYGKESMELSNGSKIKITTTTSSAGRGSSCNVLFIDEADHIEHNLLNSFWSAVYPIISSSKKSKIIMASTPRDTSGIFYRLYKKSIDDTNSVWKSMVIKWNDIPGRDEEWVKETKLGMDDPTKFAQEFECEFQQIGDSTIDAVLMEELKKDLEDPLYVYDEGKYLLWDTPQPDRIYVAGVDVSEGIMKDSSVIQILDITDVRSINQVAIYRSNSISPMEFTPKLDEILQHWGKPLVLIERNNCGAQVVDNLRREFNYENIVSYGESKVNTVTNKRLGMICHTNTKFEAIQNQRYWINVSRAIRIKDVNTVNELKDFVRIKGNLWGAKSGSHDDRVMALFWALMILHDDLVERYFDVIQRDDNRKPYSIQPIDYGIKYFSNPHSMYRNEKDGAAGDAMPTIFGGIGGVQDNPDYSELLNMGYKPL